MRENLIIYACKQGATSAKELQDELDCRRVGHPENVNVREIPRGALVVNYGFGYVPAWAYGKQVRYLNHPNAVARKISKIWQIKRMREAGVPTLELTSYIETARSWLDQGFRVLARRDDLLDGEGIQVLVKGDKVPYADFYTKEFKKTHEYRVHVFNGKVIDLVERRQGKNYKNPQTKEQEIVRSWNNGWIFAHQNIAISPQVRESLCSASVRAVAAVGLDFGAVDILVAQHGGLIGYAVCEVNSAPGLVKDQTVAAYAKAINEVYEQA